MLRNSAKLQQTGLPLQEASPRSFHFHKMSDLSQSHQPSRDTLKSGTSEQITSGGSVDHSWTCLKCTLINKRDAKECEVCEASKPAQGNTTNQLQYDKSEEGQHEKKNENSSNQTQLEERMTRALECPVCWVVMKANIFQCAKGHIICRTCYLRREMKNCPVCRKKYNKRAPVRCLFAEQMAQNLGNNS